MFLKGRQRSVNEIDDRGGPRVGIMAVVAKIDTATKAECVPFLYLYWKSQSTAVLLFPFSSPGYQAFSLHSPIFSPNLKMKCPRGASLVIPI